MTGLEPIRFHRRGNLASYIDRLIMPGKLYLRGIPMGPGGHFQHGPGHLNSFAGYVHRRFPLSQNT